MICNKKSEVRILPADPTLPHAERIARDDPGSTGHFCVTHWISKLDESTVALLLFSPSIIAFAFEQTTCTANKGPPYDILHWVLS